MNKMYVLLLAMVATVSNLRAQTAGDSVKAAVTNLFTAMKSADSAGVLAAFNPGAFLQSVSEKDGNTSVKDEKLTDFAHVIAGLQKGDADERITFKTVKVDGPLAIVWTPYQFYYKGTFSHCGVDSYQIVRINGAWKIQYLIDTRRKDGCIETKTPGSTPKRTRHLK